MSSSIRDSLLSTKGRRLGVASVGGVDYPIRSITAREYANVEAYMTTAAMHARSGQRAKAAKATNDAYITLVILGMVNGDGSQVFREDDREALSELDSGTIQGLSSKIMEHCGIDAVELEAIAKNSERTQSESSPTA